MNGDFILSSTLFFLVSAVLIEILTVVARMAENTVKYNLYANTFGFFAKIPEISFRTKQWVNFHVVSSIITVVGIGFKNGV